MMLNEYVELKAYITNPESDPPAIQPKLFTGNFSDSCSLNGIEEIMTVIARGFLFYQKTETYHEHISEAFVDRTVELLKRWTGFEAFQGKCPDESAERMESPEEIAEWEKSEEKLEGWIKENGFEEGWLKKYWMFQFSEKQKRAREKVSAEAQWKKVSDKWSGSLNSELDYRAKKITYHNIIANALELGPLRNRLLLVPKNKDASKPKKKVEKKFNMDFKYLFDPSGAQKKTVMKGVKVIAAYLLRREIHPDGQREVWIKNSELAGWEGLDDGNNGTATWYPELFWNGKPVFHRQTYPDFSKMYIDEAYLEQFDFKIMDREEEEKIRAYQDSHWILEDCSVGLEGCFREYFCEDRGKNRNQKTISAMLEADIIHI